MLYFSSITLTESNVTETLRCRSLSANRRCPFTQVAVPIGRNSIFDRQRCRGNRGAGNSRKSVYKLRTLAGLSSHVVGVLRISRYKKKYVGCHKKGTKSFVEQLSALRRWRLFGKKSRRPGFAQPIYLQDAVPRTAIDRVNYGGKRVYGVRS